MKLLTDLILISVSIVCLNSVAAHAHHAEQHSEITQEQCRQK